MLKQSRRLLPGRNLALRDALNGLALGLVLAFVVILGLGLGVAVAQRSATPVDPEDADRASIATSRPTPPTVAIAPLAKRRFPGREASGPLRPADSGSRPTRDASTSWWVGTAGVALALAAVGWLSLAARRYTASIGGGPGTHRLRVVGRTSLSPRHSVYLVDVGGRVLILGTGPQGAPTLLGDLNDPPAPIGGDS